MFKTFKTNYELRSFLTSSFSFFINIAFLVYNLVFGIINKTVWNWSISIYYALLITFRASILLLERKWNKEKATDLEEKRLKLFNVVCWCLLIMDFALIAPISLMVMSKRSVKIGMISTIAIAAYTTYKVTLAIINFSKKKSKINLSIRTLRQITLKDAVVSVLTLQNTMVMVFGNMSSMLTLTALTSAGMLLVLIAITISGIVNSHKQKRKN